MLFRSTQNKDFKIVRGIKPNIFEIYCDDRLINQDADIRDYQEQLEKQILRTNFRSFSQVVILGSASYVPFMQLPAQQRRSIIEDLLDLEIFTVMNTLLKEKIQENTALLSENSSKKTLAEEKIKLMKKHLQEVQAMSEEQIAQKTKSIEKLRTEIADEELRKTELESMLFDLKQSLADEESLVNKLDKLKKLRTQFEVKSSKINSEMKFFEDNESCPTCKQKIDHAFKCRAIGDYNTKLKEMEEGCQKLDVVYTQVAEDMREVLTIKKNMNDMLSDLQQVQYKINFWLRDISNIQKEIENIKTTYNSTDGVRIVDLENELLNIRSNGFDLQEDRHVLSAAAALLKDGGIKTKIVNQYIPIINKMIQKYLADFDFFCEFYLDEQFNETIKSRYRDEFSYNSFSEGEKSRIDLAILFTWRALAKMRNSLNTNLLIFDEVFDSALSSQGADDLLKILDGMGNDTGVFVISHRDTLFEKFNNSIKFVKRANFSTIEGSEQ